MERTFDALLSDVIPLKALQVPPSTIIEMYHSLSNTLAIHLVSELKPEQRKQVLASLLYDDAVITCCMPAYK